MLSEEVGTAASFGVARTVGLERESIANRKRRTYEITPSSQIKQNAKSETDRLAPTVNLKTSNE